MSLPAIYNFPDSYQNDGISAFTITIKYENGTPVNLIGSDILMQIKNSTGGIMYEFSTYIETANTIIIPQSGGVIQFPEILTYPVINGDYYYDLQVTDSAGFVKTYIKGTWKILKDISKV